MGLRLLFGIWLGGLACVATLTPAFAQYYYYYRAEPDNRPDPRDRRVRVYDQYGRPLGYIQPRQAHRPYYVQPRPGFNLRRLFGIEDEPRPEPKPRTPRVRSGRAKSSPPAVTRQEEPKIAPSTHVVVFGDVLADLTGQGLGDLFDDTPEVAVIRKARTESGLVRDDVVDWPKAIEEILDGGQKITVAVVMLGSNDRQPIREGDMIHEPLSDRWKQIYRERVDAVMWTFQERNIPVVWIGIPPIRNDKLSVDYLAMNEIFRESVERLGGSYVDIWPGFVDDENRYTATGPDVNGHSSRLRTRDGVRFTQAGARKAAHFADEQIKRIIKAERAAVAVAANPENPTVSGPGVSTEQVAGVSPEAGVSPIKPAVGPVLPLTRPEISPGGTLVTNPPKLEGEAAQAQKALRDGIVPSPRRGRADDYRWPKS